MTIPDQPSRADEVLRDLIEQWETDENAPRVVYLENVRGEWAEPTAYFLAAMVEQGWHAGDALPRDYRDGVEAITGRAVGNYAEAAAALLATLEGRERA